jgi:MoaA/NifB/PqqE/SkfB family radical SAM enzyme
MKIFLTNKCNLNCVYCFKDKRKQEPELLSIINQIKKARKRIMLKGGEPLLRKDIFYILKFAKSRNLKIGLETNGILLNRKILSYVDEVYFVFDSSNFNEWQKITRKGKNEFNKSLRAIKLAKKLGKKVYVDSLLTKLNLKNLGETKDFCKKYNLILRILENPLKPGFSYSNSISLPLKEAKFLGNKGIIHVKAPEDKSELNSKRKYYKTGGFV